MRNGIGQKILFDVPCQNVWRPIHYLGSKFRLADTIRELVNDIGDGPVCDLFAGSGTVSLALSHSRTVVANDIQEYSRVICTALLRPASISDAQALGFLRHAASAQEAIQKLVEPLL